MTRNRYHFADLSTRPEMVDRIRRLEHSFQQELGEEITLIAYAKNENVLPDGNCRAGLDD